MEGIKWLVFDEHSTRIYLQPLGSSFSLITLIKDSFITLVKQVAAVFKITFHVVVPELSLLQTAVRERITCRLCCSETVAALQLSGSVDKLLVSPVSSTWSVQWLYLCFFLTILYAYLSILLVYLACPSAVPIPSMHLLYQVLIKRDLGWHNGWDETPRPRAIPRSWRTLQTSPSLSLLAIWGQ